MAQLSAAPLELTAEQHQALEAMVRTHTRPQPWVIRARIIVRAATVKGFGRPPPSGTSPGVGCTGGGGAG